MRTIKLFCLILSLLFSTFNLQAQLLEENFTGIAGDTLGNYGWISHSGQNTPIYITPNNLSKPNYPSNSGNSAHLLSGQDYNKSFTSTPVNSGNLYCALLVNIDSAKSSGDYFFHTYRTGAASSYLNRVFVRKASNNNLCFGVLKGTSTTNIAWTDSIYSINTTYLLVLKLQIVSGSSNDIPSLFVDPAINGTEPSPTVTATDISSTDYLDIDRIAIRQGSQSSCPGLTLDGIRIATTWTDAVGTGNGIDNTPPTVTSATASSTTTVKVNFSEPVTQTSAETTTNYTIAGNTISSAVLANGNQVTLTLDAELTPNMNYTLTVSGITDLATPANTMSAPQDLTINYIVNYVADIAELKTKAEDNSTVYTLKSEAILTYKQSNRNQKFIQDTSGAILIDDQAGVISTVYNIGDGITGIKGRLTSYFGMYQFVPTQDPGVATSTGNTIPILDVTISQLLDSVTFKSNQSKLIRIVDARFTDANGSLSFATNSKYRISAGGITDSTFKTSFYNADYIATVLPQGTGTITGIAQFLFGRYQITARDAADIDIHVGINEHRNAMITIYPNPAKSFLNINLDDHYEITALSLLGQRVFHQTNASGQIRLDCSAWGKGIFFIQVRNESHDQITTQRLIIE